MSKIDVSKFIVTEDVIIDGEGTKRFSTVVGEIPLANGKNNGSERIHLLRGEGGPFTSPGQKGSFFVVGKAGELPYSPGTQLDLVPDGEPKISTRSFPGRGEVFTQARVVPRPS